MEAAAPAHAPKRVIRENRTVESDGLCPSLLCLTKGPPAPQKEERAKDLGGGAADNA